MGKQVQIVSVGPDHTLQLNKKELERILLAPNVKDKPVALVSIMGAFRQGKSFLMNFLMRYLRSHDKTNWMGDEDTPLEGFSWSTGTERNTIGIHVWDEVFLVRTPTGGELAVLLMDTQGAFDSDTSADETANLFALSILTSSVQIYNISKNIQEDHLQHLQLVAEYCMETQESPTGSQFQKLVFLIRDWQYPDDNAYGAVGGRSHLEQFISTSTQQHQDNKDLRKSLDSCFSSLDCFLMPHPGKATAEESNRNAKEEAKTFYVEQIQNVIYDSIQELEEIHESLLQISRDIFRAARKTGGEDVKKRYLDMLEKVC
ncbi:hypothetical protein HPB52_018152 [Rhipicephalus sanguineus]|uniref:GB1/RHD3-type G domain-containing protein n=1 Tax=Rhipicephalus sanguineus TaxID=34632 RepID=A0A9D4PFB5_RHISA|nr:hypothetical protein HPB52_018152 [Rhipicephalus sanguineus]